MIKEKIKEAKREFLSGAAFNSRNLSPKENFLVKKPKSSEKQIIVRIQGYEPGADYVLISLISLGFFSLGVAFGWMGWLALR